MGTDLLDLYDRASSWANEKVAGATEKLDARTPCDDKMCVRCSTTSSRPSGTSSARLGARTLTPEPDTACDAER